ncbi:hypothetical protein ACCO45_009607 [Purpureocillium lilacinum]|uniref:Uncharacterized protein n=1 Tax=Purpureocillium lilacinum TaxID=33203 RepID=A0ACC4DK59_PURLI
MAKTGRNKEPEAVRCSQHAAPSPVVPFQLRLQTLASIRSGMAVCRSASQGPVCALASQDACVARVSSRDAAPPSYRDGTRMANLAAATALQIISIVTYQASTGADRPLKEKRVTRGTELPPPQSRARASGARRIAAVEEADASAENDVVGHGK